MVRSGVLFLSLLFLCPPVPAQDAPADEPAAHALYDRMVQALREAETLSWVASYQWESQGNVLGRATYRVWLKKPNQYRVEATHVGGEGVDGTLVGDGDHQWIFWPNGKPRYSFEYDGGYADEYEKYRLTSYMTKSTPQGRHSIAHETGNLAAGMSMTILDPSTFHGYTDSMQPYLDGVRGLGEDTVDGEPCDGIEVSLMDHQRSWYLWLARKDHLPRKLRQVVRVSHDIVTDERWSEVTVGADIPDGTFVWTPPTEWHEWSMPPIEAGLLKNGTVAPDFALSSMEGDTVHLSDFRGKTVWLFKWRVG